MTTDSWDEALDALEEWLRRTAAELAGDGPEAPAVALPTTPVPEGLRLRATAHDDFVLALARRLDVADLVEVAPPLPYADALAEMLRADALLLLQSNDCNDQIPAKAYEYLRARRPVLTLADPAGDTAQLMRRAGLPQIAALEDGPGVAAVLDRFLDDLFHGRAALPAASAIAAASRESRTGELARVLDEACAPQMPTAEARP